MSCAACAARCWWPPARAPAERAACTVFVVRHPSLHRLSCLPSCMQCFNVLGVGNWSLPSTFTTTPSVPSQPEPPQLVQADAVCYISAPAAGWQQLYRDQACLRETVKCLVCAPGISICLRKQAVLCTSIGSHAPLGVECASCAAAACAGCVLQDAVTLQWQPPADNGSAITFYKLEMDDGQGGDFHHVYGGQAAQLSAVVTGLQVSQAAPTIRVHPRLLQLLLGCLEAWCCRAPVHWQWLCA